MLGESVQPTAENDGRAIRGFVMDIESHLANRVKHEAENTRYQAYFESLGGTKITAIPFPSETHAIANSFSPLNKLGYVKPLNSQIPFKQTVMGKYPLSEVLAESTQFPDFWQSVASNGFVSNVVYSQPAFDKPDGDRIVTIGKEGDVAIPNTLVELKDDIVRIFFLQPSATVLLWPRCIAEDTFTFGEVPIVIDRAFRIYCNACETRRRPLFFDVDPTHVRYKRKPYKRLAIEYQIDRPNRMRPVMVEVQT